MSAPTIAEAATRYVLLVDEVRRLRKARNALFCAHMAPFQDEEGTATALHPDGQPWQRSACWNLHYEQVGLHTVDEWLVGDGSARGWCEPCGRRQRLHAELLAATRAKTGAMLTLRAAVRRGIP